MTSSLTRVVARHPLPAFTVLAYALSWWAWPLYAAGLSPSPVVGFGPCLAALLVLAATRGRAGVGALLRRMVRWRVGLRWYAVALLLPAAVALAAGVLNVLLGAPAPTAVHLGRWPGVLPTLLLYFLVPGIGGTWEEPGWRGYALPRLLAGHSALAASLLVGAIWAGWHLPLYLAGTVPWSDSALTVAMAVVLTWLVARTEGSVLLAMVLHAASNTFGGAFVSPMFAGADAVRQSWLLGALWGAAALIVVVRGWPGWLARPVAAPVPRPGRGHGAPGGPPRLPGRRA